MNKQVIADAISSLVESSQTANYGAWRIGLTHELSQRKKEHKDSGKDVQYWKQWQADSLSDAEEIESYFINTKKMKGGTGGNLSSAMAVYVYIF